MVAILLGTGFEEIEALAACDILRRAGVNVQLVGIGGKEIAGAHNIRVCADCTMEELALSELEMIVLPGGLGGVSSVLGSEAALDAVRQTAAAGRYVAAICAAPTVLAQLGLTDGRNVVCYPGMEPQMGSAIVHPDQQAVVDGRIVTGRAPGAALEFGLTLVRELCGEETAAQVAAGLVYSA
jgi:4-methyl-5(b-hydroxyethyl)-thiazole monophosphate biosynthesis